MPIYQITNPYTNQTLKIQGDSPPSEKELDRIFSATSKVAANKTQSAPSPAKKQESFWGKAGRIAGDIAAEPFKIAGEAIAAPFMAGKKAYVGLTKVLPATLGTLSAGRPLHEALSAGTEARKGWEAGGGGQLPFQSKTSQFIGNKLISPAVNKLGDLTGQPELLSGTVEAGGDIAALFGIKPAGKALAGTGKNLLAKVAKTQVPEKLYASAAKLPLSKAWTKQLGEKGVTKRKMAVKAGLEGEVPISEVGIEKARNLEKTHREMVDSIIKQLDANGTLIPKEKLRPGLSAAQNVADTEGTATAQKMVNSLYDKRFEKMGTIVKVGEKKIPAQYRTDAMGQKILVAPEKIEPVMERHYTPSEVQTIKRHLYKMENYEKQKLSRGLGSQIKELGNKGMAHEAKVALEDLYPELKDLNKKDAAYINLTEALERAVPRIQNKDIVGLGTKVLLTGTRPGTAIIEHVLGLPFVKARLAFALNRARKIKKTPVARDAAKAVTAGIAKSATTPAREESSEPIEDITE